jgi:hypothetical protein
MFHLPASASRKSPAHRTFGELEAAQALVLNLRGVAADHMADVQLGHFVVRQIDRFVPGAAKLRNERIGVLA